MSLGKRYLSLWLATLFLVFWIYSITFTSVQICAFRSEQEASKEKSSNEYEFEDPGIHIGHPLTAVVNYD